MLKGYCSWSHLVTLVWQLADNADRQCSIGQHVTGNICKSAYTSSCYDSCVSLWLIWCTAISGKHKTTTSLAWWTRHRSEVNSVPNSCRHISMEAITYISPITQTPPTTSEKQTTWGIQLLCLSRNPLKQSDKRASSHKIILATRTCTHTRYVIIILDFMCNVQWSTYTRVLVSVNSNVLSVVVHLRNESVMIVIVMHIVGWWLGQECKLSCWCPPPPPSEAIQVVVMLVRVHPTSHLHRVCPNHIPES